MSNATLPPLVDLLKTLAHPARLRVLALLRQGELCVCQIAEVLNLPTSTVSEHLNELRRAGLLEERKAGRWVHYGLKAPLDPLLEALWPRLDPVEAIGRDLAAALAIRSVPLEVTCGRLKPIRKGVRHGG